MNKILIILSCLLLIIPIGCYDNKNVTSHDKVIINLPKDDTVNGYRLETENKTNSVPQTIGQDEVNIGKTPSSQSDTSSQTVKYKYCANLNSKVIHNYNCSSVKNMKEDNKFHTNDINSLLNQGYKTCQKCNP